MTSQISSLGEGNTKAAQLIYNLKVRVGTVCKRLNNTLQSKEINIMLRVSGLVSMKNLSFTSIIHVEKKTALRRL